MIFDFFFDFLIDFFDFFDFFLDFFNKVYVTFLYPLVGTMEDAELTTTLLACWLPSPLTKKVVQVQDELSPKLIGEKESF